MQRGANGGATTFVSGQRWQSPVSPNALKHNGQRWHALAVQDYESRALPLSYGGNGSRKLATGPPSLKLDAAEIEPSPWATLGVH